MNSKKTSAQYYYGVRIDGLASQGQLLAMAANVVCLLVLVIVTGSWEVLAVLVYATTYLLRWCHDKRQAADAVALRQFQIGNSRAFLARAAGVLTHHRLATGQQLPLEIAP